MKRTYLIFTGIAAATLLFSACSEPNSIGVVVQPASDKVGVIFTDTITVHTNTVKELPFVSNQNSFNLVGYYTDPLFGAVSASTYMQFGLPANAITIPSDATPDSLILSLAYGGVYGDTSVNQTINIYELKEKISKDSSYKTDQTFTTDPTLIGNVTFTPKTGDSVKVGGDNKAPQIRISLPALATKLISAQSIDLSDDSHFLSFLNGLYLTSPANTGNGSIIYINPSSDQTKLTLYYKSGGNSFSVSFPTSSSCARVNHFDHFNYAGAPDIVAQINNPALGDNVSYVQSMVGVKTRVTFPTLTKVFKGQKVTINRAELLIFPVLEDPINDAKYAYPPKLLLRAAAYDNSNLTMMDELEGANYFDGAYNTEGNGAYRFNIARHIQLRLNSPTVDGYGLFILADAAAVRAHRVVVGGGKNSKKYRMKLRLTYTKI